MTPTQLESVRAARLQLIDLGDEKTAKLLDWAVTEEPIADDEVLVALKRPEGYEDVHPQLVAEDLLGANRAIEYRTITKES